MKSKKKQKIVGVLFLLVLIFIGNYYLGNLINNKVNHEINSYTLTNLDILRTSGHWNLSPFVIDDLATGVGAHNWTWAEAQPWCSGSGTFEEPYLIENVTIDGLDSGSCITIKNSNKYFRIENCTVFNSGAGGFDAGIRLDYVGNGTLVNNNCSFNNRYGIRVRYSDNTTISGNTANNNKRNGISLSTSNSTTVSGNTANNNNYEGIIICGSDINNNISGNTANNNSIGIYIDYSDNITVSGNIANNNIYEGILLDNCPNNNISGNTANNNGWFGIFFGYSHNTTISGNTANNNSWDGIRTYGSDNTTISGNTANNNSRDGISLYISNSTNVSGNIIDNNANYGIYISESDYNLIYKNYFTNNGIHALDEGISNNWNFSTIGNFWDNYTGHDDDLDGIGDSPHIFGTGIDYLPIWNFQSPIHIDDSPASPIDWAWAETQPWCSGSGTFSDPYIIDGLNITARGVGNGILIENSYKYFKVQNCKLIESGSGTNSAGIYLETVGNGTLTNNNCSLNNNAGIYLYYSYNTTVSGNTANNNSDCGIFTLGSYNTTISGNTANNNSFAGIFIDQSDNTTISGNTANSNTHIGIWTFRSGNTIFSGNAANNGKNGIFIDQSDNTTVSGNTANNNSYYGIRLYDSDNNTVSGNTANNNQNNGIILYYSDNTTVSGNAANNNSYYGIHLDESDNTTVSGNIANNNSEGIRISHSNNTTGSGNTVNNNSDYGILLYYSDNNNILGNTANNNSYCGIYLYYSDNNTVSGNTVNNNSFFGMLLNYSNNNTVSGNIANNNQDIGIYLYFSNSTTVSGNIVDNNVNYGIYIFSSDYNLIYKNYFNDNIINAYDNGTENEWDDGIIGNYWDDYDGVDANDDGIGDTPYIIPGIGGGQDNYPIWADGDSIAPVITIILPAANSVFGLDAPSYQIIIVELNLDTIWYTLDGGTTNYSITNLTGTFNQLAWGALSEGSITIRFYANDTAGNIGSAAVTVKKDIAPVITIIFPLPNSVFDLVAPNYNISIDELNLDTIWYTLDGGITNYTITGLTGTFNQLAWEALSEGSVTIRFYANDTAGNIGFTDVEVIIEIPEDLDGIPIISFGNYYILFTFIAILSFIILEKRKKK